MTAQSRNFWENLGAKRFAPGKGVTDPPPQDGWKRFFFILGTHFWKLVTLNLLFVAFSIPLITIPAAFCGMNRALIKLYRDGNCFVWTEFFQEFRVNLWKALPFGVLSGAMLFAAYYFLSLSISDASNRIAIIPAAIGLLLAIASVLHVNYAFVFLPSLDLKNRDITRNAMIFLLTEWKTNVIILAVTVIMVFASISLFPYSLTFLVLLAFSLQQYIICTAINKPLQKRIIGPYEERKKGTAQIERALESTDTKDFLQIGRDV